MKTASALSFKKLPKDYHGLVMLYMPRAIHDRVDYDNTVEIIDALAGHSLNDDQELYLDTLSTLVEAYEDQHVALKSLQLSPLDALRFLMNEHGMNAADLGKLLGERTLGSKILRADRKIGLSYARILATRFNVDIGLFLA